MEKTRERAGKLSGTVGVCCNTGLAVMKLIVGYTLSSMAVMGDGLNNLSDAVSSLITLFGSRLSAKSADEEHPFGHARLEYVASAIVSVLIIQVGLTLIQDSIKRVIHPEEMSVYPVAIILLALSVLVKCFMFVFNRALYKKSGSKLLLATATDSMFDMITTSMTIATTIIYAVTGVNLDAYAGIIVSIIIIIAGAGMLRDMMNPLLGGRMDENLVKELTEFVDNEPGVLGCHDVVIHNYGPDENMATVHIELDKNLTLAEAHKIADKVEHDVLNELNIQLVTHSDPSDINDQRAKRIKSRVTKILTALDPKLSFHDFQVEEKEAGKYLVTFDLLVPLSYSHAITDERKRQVSELLSTMNQNYEFKITIDHGIIEEKDKK
ncbi:MAG: cation diffusion facilitator family transporter [Catonella sp.]|nr:cation diffusion facilitator family transporter [Catonella sp.]MDY6356988.1 cation diffusion facilitator family transporter [Catonella sp.]